MVTSSWIFYHIEWNRMLNMISHTWCNSDNSFSHYIYNYKYIYHYIQCIYISNIYYYIFHPISQNGTKLIYFTYMFLGMPETFSTTSMSSFDVITTHTVCVRIIGWTRLFIFLIIKSNVIAKIINKYNVQLSKHSILQ